MTKEWILGTDGYNLKFKRERLLNDATNRWGLNKTYNVGPTSELIRNCAPETIDKSVKYYFENAVQNKKNGIKISREYLHELGQKLYIKLTEVVQSELDSITEEECIEYVYNLVINRTYEGYTGEIQTIYGQLEHILREKIEPAPDKWDRAYCVDFFLKIKGKYIGFQIKPISASISPQSYKWLEYNSKKHIQFSEKYGGKVFFIFSIKSDRNKNNS